MEDRRRRSILLVVKTEEQKNAVKLEVDAFEDQRRSKFAVKFEQQQD